MANVLLEKSEGIAIISINRPEALNALNTETVVELGKVVDAVKADDEVRVVIITGAGGKAFVAGADIAEMQSKNAEAGFIFGTTGQAVFEKIEGLARPVIAAINGFALGGGCELAMACDIRLASEKAKFGQPEVGLGIIPGFGGTQRLPRLVGKGKAMELILTGGVIPAAEALRIGLVDKVVEGDVLEAAKELAKNIAAKSPLAIRYAKAAVNKGLQSDVNTAIAYEASLLGLCFATEDQKEGMAAFLGKRKPEFKGR